MPNPPMEAASDGIVSEEPSSASITACQVCSQGVRQGCAVQFCTRRGLGIYCAGYACAVVGAAGLIWE